MATPRKIGDYLPPLKAQGINYLQAATKPGQAVSPMRVVQSGDSPFRVNFSDLGLDGMADGKYIVCMSSSGADAGVDHNSLDVDGFDIVRGREGDIHHVVVFGTLRGQLADGDAAPGNVEFQAPAGSSSIPLTGASTRYLAPLTGSDANDGTTPATAWKTGQKVMDEIPRNYAGDLTVIQTEASDISEDVSLNVRVDAGSARICFVAHSEGAAGFNISGHSFAFATNATATATVSAFSSFARGERWLRPSSFPVDDLAGFGSPLWGGTTLEASTSPVLTATMGDPSVGNACNRVCEYTGQMTANYFGTKQPGVNLQLVGFDFGNGALTREGCVFVACKATASADQRRFVGCGGFMTIMGKNSFFGAQVTNLHTDSWAQFSGAYENVLQVRNNVAQVVMSTAVIDTVNPTAGLAAASNALIGMNYCDVTNNAIAFQATGNSRAFITGNIAFNCNHICTVDDNSSCEFIGGGYTGTTTNHGVNAQKHSRIDDVSQLSAVTTGSNDVLCGALTATFAAGAVDTGAALSSVVP